MYTLTIKLKQHTPLIHFQHDQEGATLRASEVKPKLDKFVIRKLKKNGKYSSGVQEGWIKSRNGKEWLNYKMTITAEGEPQEFLIASLLSPKEIYDDTNKQPLSKDNLPFTILGNSPFFAQEKVNSSNQPDDSPVFLKVKNSNNQYDYIYNENNWKKIDKKGLFWDTLNMTLASTHTDLINTLDNYLTEFFICNNFGTRSSKGFGSFTRSCDEEDVKKYLNSNYKFVYAKNKSGSNLQDIFQTIKSDYQRIKSGKNRPQYNKSILFLYAVSKMNEEFPRWEKRFFKQAIKNIMPNKRLHVERDKNDKPIHQSICGYNDFNNDDEEEYNYRYLRAVLGLAEHYEFMLDFRDRNNTWKKDNRQKLIVRPIIQDVTRYESPILVKVISGIIYLVGNDVNNNMLNRPASISFTVGESEITDTKSLNTPSCFDLADFMHFAMRPEFNLGYKHIKESSI